ncbi:MAG: endo-1,4-beta-xylanase [Clostridia bacterium]|nr:endo-1,4-beta-xylanase [Clostridia bacterium]
MEYPHVDKEYLLRSFYENRKMLDKRNDENIERYRKGDFTLLIAGDGDKRVTVKQKKHQFKFGCNAFMIASFENGEKEKLYKEKFARLFNQAVVPFYWSDLEPEEGKLRFDRDSAYIYRRPAPDLVLDFCREYGIEPKGHCLVWNHFVPKWLEKYGTEDRKRILERRFAEIAARYADKIPSFDVVNESASNYNLGRKILFDEYDEYGLALGAKYFPHNIKILNETNQALWNYFYRFGKYMPFRAQLRDFLAKGCAIDEIGLQFHMFASADDLKGKAFRQYLDAELHLDLLDICDSFGLPMHISEITIPSYAGNIPENEAFQAELAREYYRIWFGTKNMKGIVWWNLPDGYAAYAPQGTFEGENQYAAGLLRYDLSEKPAYRVLDKLINEEWKTSFETKITQNVLDFRGFYGEYEITVEDAAGKRTATVTLDKSGKRIEI